MSRTWLRVPGVLAAVALVAGNCGCSLIGVAVGSRSDVAAARQTVAVQPASLPFLAQGTQVTLMLADSSRVTGRTLDPGAPVDAASTPTHVRLGTGSGIAVEVVVVPLAQVVSAARVPEHHAARDQGIAGLKVDLVLLALLAAYGLYLGVGAAMEAMGGYN